MLKKYYDALKPERTYANVMTAGAGFLFASQGHINWALFAYVLLGTTLVVMSACAANNVIDHNIDAQMPRTKKRATATGELSLKRLVFVSIVFGVVGLAILAVHVNWLTVLIGAIAYVDYVVLYGWSKRTTPHSTLIGTISGAAPLVAGYTAVTGRFDATALILALIMIFWQMPHFYAIGIFRRDDYKAGKLPIWPVRYGVRSTQYWILVYVVLYLAAVLSFAFRMGSGGVLFAVVMSALGLYWLVLGVKGFQSLKPEKWARGMFGFSLIILLVFSAAIALSPLLR